jgi:Bacterial Ig-like domain (group 3)/FG-GAP-like repeat
MISTGSTPAAVMEGDLDGDGKPDLVYSDVTGFVATLHVLLNQGKGQFKTGQSIALDSLLAASQLADVNGDGRLDLVGALSGISPELGVALGNGDGTFQPLITSTLPSYGAKPENVVIRPLLVADLDGDGKQDVVFSDLGWPQIWICLGDNAGHFTQTTELNDQNPAFNIYLGDFNRDGKLDLIGLENEAARIAVYLANGDGAFAPPVYYGVPGGPESALVRDMDGDGHPDMVTTGGDNVLRVLHGNSDGTFSPTLAFPVPVGAKGMFPGLLDIRDYNHDGVLDLALTSLDGVHILIGQGNFTFKPFQPAPVSGALAIGDLDQDTNTDFVCIAPGGLAILYGNPDGSLRSADAYDVGYVVSAATVADFNGDGSPDVAVGVDAVNPRILLGDGKGAFTLSPDSNTASEGENSLTAIVAGDFNGDERIDLLGSYGSPSLQQLQGVASSLGNGDGTFGPPVSVPGYNFLATTGTVVGDLNDDGRADIAATGGFFQTSFLLAQPDGSFLQESTLTSDLSINAFWAYADFNKDGRLDLALFDVGDLQVENGNGDGTFKAGFAYRAPGGPSLTSPSFSDAVTADLDGDGNIDIAAPTGLRVQVFYGHGDGTFEAPAYISLPGPPSSSGYTYSYTGINAADFNADGLMDLVLTNGIGVSVLHGTGNRAFGPPINYLAGDSVSKPLVADFNRDGYPDILVANVDTNRASTVTVLLNVPDRCTCTVAPTLTVNPEPSLFSQPFTIHLTLTGPASSKGLPTGSATFSVDTAVLGASQLVDGTADLTVTTAFPVGSHQISVHYSGDAVFPGATFTVSHRVAPFTGTTQAVKTQTLLISGPNPVSLGLPVVLTATVTAATAVQGGSISFKDGDTLLASVTVGQDGTASFTTSSLAAGTHSLTAVYSGGSGFSPSTSSIVSLQVQEKATGTAPGGASGDFTLQVFRTSATVYTGAAAKLQVTVAASGGFAQDVALACSGLPAESACVFSPSVASGGNGKVALSVQTTPPHPVTQANGSGPPWAPLSIAGAVSSLALIVLPRRARFQRTLWALLMVMTLVTMMSACGGPGPITGGTPPGVYDIAVTGAAAQNGHPMNHSVSMQLMVKAFR